MNDITKLTGKILQEAQDYRKEVAASAHEEAERIARQYEAQAKTEAEAIIAAAERQAEAIHRRAQSQAGIQERNMKLTTRRQMIDQAFARAEQKLLELPEEKLCNFLTNMVLRAQTSDAQLIWNKGDLALARKVVASVNDKNMARGMKLTLADEQGNFEGGFILRQGSIETNCTFPVLIMAVVDELETPVAKILFD